MRLAVGLEYRGTHYFGWQHQRQVPGIETYLQKAISYVANEPVALVCAGRTDRGVHATQQVVHFDTSAERDPYHWVLGINTQLPPDIRVLWVKAVSCEFHARYSATARTYRYVITQSHVKPGLLHGLVTWQRQPLDIDRMREAAQAFLGEQNFSAIRGAHCQSRSPVRNVHRVSLTALADGLVFEVTANAFLHHMVRNMIGLLMAIGTGERPVEDVQRVLATCDRTQADITAPPDGLYLVHVHYPRDFELELAPVGPFFLSEALG